jgi:hypothetical protein
MDFIASERREKMTTRGVRQRRQYDSTLLGPDVQRPNDLIYQRKTGLVMHQALSDSDELRSHDEEDILIAIGSITDKRDCASRLASNESHTAYQWPLDKRDTFQRRLSHMSVFRKVWLLPIPFCMVTFLSSAFWNLGQITGAWCLCGLTAIVVYPLVLTMTLPCLTASIAHRPLLDFKQKLVSLPFIMALVILAGKTWLIMSNTSATLGRWDLCWWCALIAVTCGFIAYF